MKEHNNIDEFVRQKMSQRTYSYDDSYWAETSAYLDAHAKPGRLRRWWLLLILLLGCTSAAAIYYWQIPGASVLPHTEISTLTTIVELPVNCDDEGKELIDLRSAVEPIASKTGVPFPVLPSTSQEKSSVLGQAKIGGFNLLENVGEEREILMPAGSLEETVLAHEQNINSQRVFDIESLDKRTFGDLSQLKDRSAFLQGPNGEAPRHALGITFGFTQTQVWGQNEDQMMTSAMRPTFGITYQTVLTQRLSLRSGLQYRQLNQPNLTQDVRIIDYDLGFNEQRIRIQTQSLHALQMPLQVDVRLKNRHHIQLGAYAGYLVGVRSQVEKTQRNSLVPSTSTTSQEWGYRTGIANWQYGLTAGYGYYLGKGTMLQVEGGWSMQDWTDDRYFQSNRQDTYRYVQLSLTQFIYSF